MTASAYVGPLSFSVLAVPADASLDSAAAELHRLRSGDAVRILDIEVISRAAHGEVRRETLDSATVGGRLAELAADETDLLDDDDLTQIGAELADGERALVIVYEDRSLARVADRVSAVGGREVWSGGVDAVDLDDEEVAP